MIVEEMEAKGVATKARGSLGLRELFESLDADASGSISFDELAQGLRRQVRRGAGGGGGGGCIRGGGWMCWCRRRWRRVAVRCQQHAVG